MSNSDTVSFKAGQKVVYPLQGVGHVQKIENKKFGGKEIPYYIIYLEASDMTVMVPTNKSEELGLRPIVNKEESKKALEKISEEYDPAPTDWKLRYQQNLDLLKEGSVQDIATVVTKLYHRSKIKELPILERKLYDNALKLLIDEISFSLEKGKDEVEQMVFCRLEAEK